jgi:hypothetical protein
MRITTLFVRHRRCMQVFNSAGEVPRPTTLAVCVYVVVRQELGNPLGKTSSHATNACGDGKLCSDPAFLKSIMGDNYPEVERESIPRTFVLWTRTI